MNSRLPPEMIEAILDHLQDDKPSLKACSLVCQAWAHPAHLLLFATSTLTWPLQPAAFHFVRHLRIIMDGRLRNGAESWDKVIPLLVGFHRIISLKIILFESLNFIDAQTWLALGKKFSKVVSLSLTDFSCDNVSSLARVICAFPHLRELSLHGVMTGAFESEQPSATTFPLPPDLDTLDLGILGTGDVLRWFLSLSARPTLRTIRLYRVHETDPAMVNEFIGALGSGLESFTLFTYIDDCTLPYAILMMSLTMLTPTSVTRHPIDITPLTRLRSIQLVLQYSTNRNRWVTQILSQISSVHLEHVVFQMYPFAGSIDIGLSNALEWSEVDAILQSSTFSRLKNVEVRSGTRLWNTGQVPDPQRPFSAQIIERLPQCHARGIFLC
jgi:hypothetical protein